MFKYFLENYNEICIQAPETVNIGVGTGGWWWGGGGIAKLYITLIFFLLKIDLAPHFQFAYDATIEDCKMYKP